MRWSRTVFHPSVRPTDSLPTGCLRYAYRRSTFANMKEFKRKQAEAYTTDVLRKAPSAIDNDHLSGDELRLRQKHDGIVDVGGSSRAAQRRAANKIFSDLRS